ncbi:hypothetical protein CMI46_01965 [Candidatus Pacearchaeota archaeon]|nr:hypothetical protein [Candidatus Pacearchaeota archaeon]|tara:strand:- start:2918 stop:3139 length:222 start_codon:yes stop_codon:yes gene_type:complete
MKVRDHFKEYISIAYQTVAHPFESLKHLLMIGEGYGVSEERWEQERKKIYKDLIGPHYATEEDIEELRGRVLE